LLVLRLARTGRRNQPKYRLVVAENSKPLDGKVVEVVGHYNPTDPNKPLVIEKEVISAWLGKGAMPSNTVAKLLNKEGFNLPVHQHPVRPAKKAPKGEAAPAAPAADLPSEAITEEAPKEELAAVTEEAAPEAVSEAVSETPVEEVPVESVVETASEAPATKAEAPAKQVAEEVPAQESETKPEGEAGAE